MRLTHLFIPAFILIVVARGFPVDASAQAAPKPGALTSGVSQNERLLEKLKGATYRAEQGTIRLKGGSFRPAGGGFGSESTWLEAGATAFALEPETAPIGAAVILNVNEGGTATWTQLHAVRFAKGGTRDLGYIDLGDRVGVKRLTIQGDEVTATLATFAPGDGACCPSLETTTTYRLNGSVLVRKLPDPEVAEALRVYESAVTNRAAVEMTLALDPAALNAMQQLQAQLRKAKVIEQEAHSRIRKSGLMSDPRFSAAVRERIDSHNKILDSPNLSFRNPGEQRAVLVLGAVRAALRELGSR